MLNAIIEQLKSIRTFRVDVDAYDWFAYPDVVFEIILDAPPTNEQTLLAVNELTARWKKWFPLISFATGYENTNRCDEAIGALAIHFKNGNGEDFSVALSEFRDALDRLRILEGFHWQSIF